MRRFTLVAAATLASAACEHPVGIVTPHIEAADLVVADSAGVVLTRTEFNRAWSVDSLVLRDGTSLRLVLVPLDFRNVPIDVAERGDLSFRMEAEHGALLQWEPQRGYGMLHPFGAGTTRARFLIWHITHADFVTPWLRVIVLPRLENRT